MPFVNASSNAAGVNTAIGYIPSALLSGKARVALAEFTCASDAAGTYTVPIRLPRGARVLTMFMNASATMGASATIAIGIAGTAGKYRAAATYTAADTLSLFSLNAATGAVLAAEEQIIMTVAVAALPASGRLLIGFLYVIES
jgi:hypothetical protein